MPTGFLDPDSFHDKTPDHPAHLTFVDAVSGEEHQINIDSQEMVTFLADRIEDQKSYKIINLDHPMRVITGTIRISTDDPNTGILMDANEPNKRIPFKFGFDVDSDGLSKEGMCAAIGMMDDGVFQILRLTITPATTKDLQPTQKPTVS